MCVCVGVCIYMSYWLDRLRARARARARMSEPEREILRNLITWLWGLASLKFEGLLGRLKILAGVYLTVLSLMQFGGRNSLRWGKPQSFPLRPSTDWLKPTHISQFKLIHEIDHQSCHESWRHGSNENRETVKSFLCLHSSLCFVNVFAYIIIKNHMRKEGSILL